MTEPDLPAEADSKDEAVGLDCLRCHSVIESVGTYELRTGGTTGAAKLFFGEWAELGEGKMPFELLVCPLCRHAEFRAAW